MHNDLVSKQNQSYRSRNDDYVNLFKFYIIKWASPLKNNSEILKP